MTRHPALPEPEPNAGFSSLYKLVGGRDSCLRLSMAFYARVDRDSVLRPLFPGKSLTCAIESFAAFLAQFLDGPGEDAQRRWWLSLHESHMRFSIGPEQRAAWMSNMVAALDDVPFEEPVRTELLTLFDRSSAYLVNRGEKPIPQTELESSGDNIEAHAEISQRWETQLRLDEAVAAISGGNADRAISLAESSMLQTCSPSGRGGLLALMIQTGNDVMLAYVREKLTRDPALIYERLRHGRTLLHEAAAAGNSAMTGFLISLGADPDARDIGGHTPLYSLANECSAEGPGEVVRTLVQSGADVNADDGVKHCTPLHMAARRGNLEVAEALLGCGANIEARDSLGDTPLRRAVNCNKIAVASMLVAHGADVRCIESKGATPLSAARTPAMKKLLHT